MVWRSVKVDGILSDVANLSRSKDNVMARAVREVAWNAANDPPKMRIKTEVWRAEIVAHCVECCIA
jgi:hypothetical protein